MTHSRTKFDIAPVLWALTAAAGLCAAAAYVLHLAGALV